MSLEQHPSENQPTLDAHEEQHGPDHDAIPMLGHDALERTQEDFEQAHNPEYQYDKQLYLTLTNAAAGAWVSLVGNLLQAGQEHSLFTRAGISTAVGTAAFLTLELTDKR